jgi:hypothetical protein
MKKRLAVLVLIEWITMEIHANACGGAWSRCLTTIRHASGLENFLNQARLAKVELLFAQLLDSDTKIVSNFMPFLQNGQWLTLDLIHPCSIKPAEQLLQNVLGACLRLHKLSLSLSIRSCPDLGAKSLWHSMWTSSFSSAWANH